MSDTSGTNTDPPNDKPARRQREPDPLAGTEFEHLPEVFAMRSDDGVTQEREPAYLCRADCFLGTGREATLYEESSIVVTSATPNEHMEPLNRAAAINYVKWIEKLPQHGASIDAGDVAEAAQMLATDPDHTKLNKVAWYDAVTQLAVRLKLKRLGNDARAEMPMGHNFTRRSGRTAAPPILGAKIAELGARLPGETRFAAAIPTYGPNAPITRRATAAPMGGPLR